MIKTTFRVLNAKGCATSIRARRSEADKLPLRLMNGKFYRRLAASAALRAFFGKEVYRPELATPHQRRLRGHVDCFPVAEHHENLASDDHRSRSKEV